MAKKAEINPLTGTTITGIDAPGLSTGIIPGARSGFSLYQPTKDTVYGGSNPNGIAESVAIKLSKRLKAQYDSISKAAGEQKIDQQTFGEIQDLLNSSNATFNAKTGKTGGQWTIDYINSITKKASSIFSAAMKGTDEKYKARRSTEIMYQTLVDQPGRKQTVFTAPPKTPTGV